MTTPAKSSRERVRAHRARMRAQGLRPVQLWVPFISEEEARRQCDRVRNNPGEADDIAFVASFGLPGDDETR